MSEQRHDQHHAKGEHDPLVARDDAHLAALVRGRREGIGGEWRSRFMSRFVALFHAFDDEVGGDVDAAGDDEEHDAEDEEHAVMLVAVDGLAHLGGDGRGHGADGIGERLRDAVAVAGGEQHGHRFADGAAHAEHARGEQAVARGGEEHAAHGFPLVRAERERGLAIAVRHGAQRVLGERDDERDAHQREDDSAGEQVRALRRAGLGAREVERHHDVAPGAAGRRGEDVLDDRPEHHQADEAPDDRRNRREQFDDDLERLLHLPLRELRDVHRRAQAHRHGDQQRDGRDAEGADDQRERAEARVVAGRGIGNPARAGEELHPVELRHHRRGFLEDEEEDRADADDRTPAAERG